MEKYIDDVQSIPVGSSIFVTFSYCDEEGEIVKEKQFFGLVDHITKEQVVIKNQASGEEVSLPAMFGSYEKATDKTFVLAESGEEISNIDYSTAWTLRLSSGE